MINRPNNLHKQDIMKMFGILNTALFPFFPADGDIVLFNFHYNNGNPPFTFATLPHFLALLSHAINSNRLIMTINTEKEITKIFIKPKVFHLTFR